MSVCWEKQKRRMLSPVLPDEFLLQSCLWDTTHPLDPFCLHRKPALGTHSEASWLFFHRTTLWGRREIIDGPGAADFCLEVSPSICPLVHCTYDHGCYKAIWKATRDHTSQSHQPRTQGLLCARLFYIPGTHDLIRVKSWAQWKDEMMERSKSRICTENRGGRGGKGEHSTTNTWSMS